MGHRWLGFLILVVAAPAIGFAQKNNSVRTLRSIEKIPEYFADDRNPEFNVDAEATLTYWDPPRRKAFVQAGGQAVFVRCDFDMDAYTEPPNAMSRVRIVGAATTSGGFINASSLTVVGDGEKLTPLEVELDKSPKGCYWSRWSRVKGRLLRVLGGRLGTQLVMQSGSQSFTCYLSDPQLGEFYTPLVGSEFHVTGVLDWSTHEGGAPRQAMLQIPNQSYVSLISKARPTPTTIAASPSLSELQVLEHGTRVKVDGVVTFVRPGISILLEDDTGSILAEYEGSEFLSTGTNLTVEGTIDVSTNGRRLDIESAKNSKQQNQAGPIPEVNARKVIADHVNDCRIAIAGTVESFNSIDDQRFIILRDQRFPFRLEFTANDERYSKLPIAVGKRLLCKGLVQHDSTHEAVWFTVHVASTDSIFSDQNNQLRLDRRTVIFWVLGIASSTLAGALWIGTMRAQVKKKTQHLSDLTAQLNASFDAIKEGILIADADGKVLATNRQFEAITHVMAEVGTPLQDVCNRISAEFPSPEPNQLKTDALSGAANPVDFNLECANGSRKVIAYFTTVRSEAGERLGTLLAIQDITERRDLESRLLQSQKMEAVGRLAGGIAHDFNNLLMVIGFNVRYSRELLKSEPQEITNSLQDTELAVGRATELVRNLMGFSRQSSLRLELASVNKCVRNVVSLLERTFPGTVRIEMDLNEELWSCKIDQGQIEQVIMNICLNSRDALRDNTGLIAISTRNVELHGEKFAMIHIVDDGIGMTEEIQQRIYEPFFTNRPAGDGTGLGMAVSYGIVTQHDGEISCVSQAGVGTQVRIHLPASTELATIDKSEVLPTPELPFRGTVLVVDDEPAVRRATSKIVKSLGCEVVEASSGHLALELTQNQEVDLVLLDLNMPAMSGKQVFNELSRRDFDKPVVICTGYIADPDSFTSDCGQTPVGVIQKPYTRADLRSVCQKFLTKAELQG